MTAGTPPAVVTDAWGHPALVTETETTPLTYGALATVRGLVQERTGQEIQGPELQGTVVSNAVIFLPFGTDVTPQDRIRNLENAAEYDVLYVRDTAGRGHHLEVDARRIYA